MRVVVPDEFAVAGKAAEIALQIHLFDEVRDLLDRGVIRDPVADEPLRIFGPEFVVLFDDVLGDLRHWLAVDFHDDAERREVREHPIQRKAFLDKKFVGGVVIKDDLGQQTIDGHHRDYARDLDTVTNRRYHFAGLDLFGFIRKTAVMIVAPRGIVHVFLEGPLMVVKSRRVDFIFGINVFLAAARFYVGAKLQERFVQ